MTQAFPGTSDERTVEDVDRHIKEANAGANPIQQAIEALESCWHEGLTGNNWKQVETALASLRAVQEVGLPPLLTDERIISIRKTSGDIRNTAPWAETLMFARAIESEVRTAIAAAGGGVPQGWREKLAEIVEVFEDGQKPYDHRCYVSGTLRQCVDEAKAMLASSPQPEAGPCFCDRMYPNSNPDASCGDCPKRDYKAQPEAAQPPAPKDSESDIQWAWDLAWQCGASKRTNFDGDDLESITFTPQEFEQTARLIAEVSSLTGESSFSLPEAAPAVAQVPPNNYHELKAALMSAEQAMAESGLLACHAVRFQIRAALANAAPETPALPAEVREALKVAREALVAAKRWHQGDKWRDDCTAEQRAAWEEHAAKLDAAIALAHSLEGGE